MSIEESYERFRYHTAYDVFAVRNLGFLKDLPNAVGHTVEPQHEPRPEVYLLPDCLPILRMDTGTLAAALALRSIRSDGILRVDYPPEQIHLVDQPKGQTPWSKIIKVELHKTLEKRGLKAPVAKAVQLSLRWLTVLGPGASMRLEYSEHIKRSFGTLLVDLPMKYKRGLIHVTREGRTASFDFSASRGKCNSFLHWFQDCTVTIEPITSGFRAFLIYDVVVDHMAAYPLTLHPSSAWVKGIEAQVGALVPERRFRDLHPKARFLPLVRLLLETYRVEGMEVPTAVLELCIRVAKSYEAKVQGVINAGPHLYRVPDVRRSGQEVIWSLGGKKMAQHLITQRYIKSLDKLIAQLDQLGGFL